MACGIDTGCLLGVGIFGAGAGCAGDGAGGGAVPRWRALRRAKSASSGSCAGMGWCSRERGSVVLVMWPRSNHRA